MKYILIALLLITKPVNHMKAFVVLVKVPTTYTTALAKSVNPVWEKTIADWKASGHYITSFAFPGESREIPQPTTKTDMRIVSNILLRATNMEEAVELAKACPVLKYGGSAEVREIPAGEPTIYAAPF